MTAHKHFENPIMTDFDKIQFLPHQVSLDLSQMFRNGGLVVENNNARAPLPVVTPYPRSGGNPNIPTTQTGLPYSQDYTGTINPTTYAVGTSLPGATWNTTPAPATKVPTPVPTPTRNAGPNPGYGSSFPGQTVSVNGITYRSNADGSWSIVSGGGQEPSDIDLQAIYQPAMQTLQQQEEQYRSQLPMYQQQVESDTAAGLKDVANQQATAQENLVNQQSSVDLAQKSALAQARQLYNELTQRYGSMFGSRTSAGPFAMEILGRETQKQFGNIGQTATQGTQQVKQATEQLNRWVDTQKSEWGRKKMEALNNLQNSFNNAIQTINASRNALESEKATKRYQALVDAQSKAAQIQAADKTFAQQLALFQAQNQNPVNYSQGNVVGNQVAQLGTPYNPSGVQGTPTRTLATQ